MKNINKYLMEFVGTFMFVLAIALIVSSGTEFAPIGIGLALAILVYAGAHVSGSHYNPAVSLAIWIRGKMSTADLVPYWIAQLVGAMVAAWVAFAITGYTFVAAPSENMLGAWLVEVLFTFLLAFVVLQTATTDEQAGNSYFGFAIGIAVLVGAFAGGSISGGAFNPAVGIGPALAAGNFAHILLYLVAPMAGGALAAGVFKLVNCSECVSK